MSEQAITHGRCSMSVEQVEEGRTQHGAEHWVSDDGVGLFPKVHVNLKEGMLTLNYEHQK